jgi:hypothetical protein
VGKSFILPTYLQHLNQLDYPKKHIHIAILFNHPNKEDKVAVPHTTINQKATPSDEVTKIRQILKTFKRKTRKQYGKISIHEYTGNYEDRTIQGQRAMGRWMEYFAEIRNEWIRMRRPKDDYIFSIDSDILVPKNSLKQLLSHDKDIISLLLANGPVRDPYISPNRLDNFLLPYNVTYGGIHTDFISRVNATGRMAFNVMMKYNTTTSEGVRNEYDHVNYRHVDPAELHVRETLNYDPQIYYKHLKHYPDLGPWTVPQRYGELTEVDMTGAAYLIKREVLDNGVEYGYHHQGEDCFFSALAQDKGFKLYCDYNIRANHIMNEGVYRDYLGSKQLRFNGYKKDEKPKPPEDGIKESLPVCLELVNKY